MGDPAASRAFITGGYRRAWRHPDATIDALALNAIGHVPWWPPDQNEVTLQHVLVRVATDTSRHAGQVDVSRELIVGTVGSTKESTSMPPGDRAWKQSPGSRVGVADRDATRPAGALLTRPCELDNRS